jgi:autotransporter passenger strand-loop-strand repeat protein
MSFQINVNWDPSVQNAPSGFQGAVNAAVSQLESLFTNDVTLNINVGWGEYGQLEPGAPANGNPIATYAIAQNNLGTNFPSYSYDAVRTQLLAIQNPSAVQQAAYANLPVNDPLNSGYPFTLTIANAEALGLTSGFTGVADDVGFSTGQNWYFGTGPAPAGQISLMLTAEHEITEGMGRSATVGTNGTENVMDLFRYLAPNSRDLTPTASGPNPIHSTNYVPGDLAYFSIDNGATNLGTWNNDVTSNGNLYDLGDWVAFQGMAPGPGGADAFGGSGPLTLSDLALLNAIGWNLSVPSNEIPSGVTDYVSNYVPSSVKNDPVPAATSPRQNMTVLNGGIMEVGPGGTADGTTIDSGGLQIIDLSPETDIAPDGFATNTTVFGTQDVYAGADQSTILGGT